MKRGPRCDAKPSSRHSGHPAAPGGDEGAAAFTAETLLRASREDRRRALENAADGAAKDYEQDPEVDDFLSFDDKEPDN